MPQLVSMGATLKCSFGAAPSKLIVSPENRVIGEGPPAANILDHLPMKNITPFGMCNSIMNPTVAAATAAALGKLTPMPCVPATLKPWVPGAPNVLIANQPLLDSISTCTCQWGGVVTIIAPGTVKIMVP